VGIIAAPGTLHPWLAFVALLAIAVGAGAAGALNMWYDADIDAVMKRTSKRPVPAGSITPSEALGFGMVLAAGSVLVLGLLVNVLAGALLAFTIFFYIAIYTMWLKRLTPQNIVIGGAAGAFPPMVGWVSVTGSIDLGSIALFLIIFTWTPPHFWALALYRVEDYAKSGLPMLPVTHGNRYTRLQVLLYTIILFACTLLPYVYGMSGLIYLVSAVALGLQFLIYAVRLYRDYSDALARRTFVFSIVYLSLLFAALLVDHYWRY
jgi:protoheme IX farnesyltransferase